MVLTKDCSSILFAVSAGLVANHPPAEDSVASLADAASLPAAVAAVAASSLPAAAAASSSLAAVVAAAASSLAVAVAVAVVASSSPVVVAAAAGAYPSAACSPRFLAAKPTALMVVASACSAPKVRLQ